MCILATSQHSLPHIDLTCPGGACVAADDCADAHAAGVGACVAADDCADAAGVESPTHGGGGIATPQDALLGLAPSCHLHAVIE